MIHIKILIEKCELLKLSFLHMLQEKDSLISSEQKDEFTFHYINFFINLYLLKKSKLFIKYYLF